MRYFGVIWFLVWMVCIIGYIKNVIDVASIDYSVAITGESVLHIIGIVVAPIGVIMGYAF